MKKLILILLVLVGAYSSVPAIRSFTEPVVQPVVVRAAPVLGPVLGPLSGAVNKPLSGILRGELSGMVQQLRLREMKKQPLPRPSEFHSFLANNGAARGGKDFWGTPYFLRITNDSIAIGSAGPDRKAGTDDDIVSSASRMRPIEF